MRPFANQFITIRKLLSLFFSLFLAFSLVFELSCPLGDLIFLLDLGVPLFSWILDGITVGLKEAVVIIFMIEFPDGVTIRLEIFLRDLIMPIMKPL